MMTTTKKMTTISFFSDIDKYSFIPQLDAVSHYTTGLGWISARRFRGMGASTLARETSWGPLDYVFMKGHGTGGLHLGRSVFFW